jgi:DeoR family fructose operon transcriptional repressor
MYSEARKAEIRSLIGQKGSVEVNSLAELFQTSRETIRRDLGELEKQGALKRTHGGAMLEAGASPPESPVAERGIRQMEEKNRICQSAAEYICANDTLFIDNSSTMIYLPRYIPPEMNLTIITNSIGFLYESAQVSNYNWLLICLGGIFKSRNLSVHGLDTIKNAEPYYPTKAFISCAGISPVNKIADSSPHEAEVKRMMIERAQEVFLLVDHTKFAKPGQIFICDFSAIDHIITDTPLESLEIDVEFPGHLDIRAAGD